METILVLNIDHKKHLQFLSEQPLQVLQDFCKLALDYLQKGPNFKLYNAAAQKLVVEPENIQNYVEGLVYLFMESTKNKLTFEQFRELIIFLGFVDEKESLLSQLYETKQSEIENAMTNIGFKLPEYHNMEWRFEAQIASRTMLKQVEPLITMDFTLKNTKETSDLKHVILQADATNLLHLTRELEAALQEEKSQQMRKIKRSIK
ncbi:hypothetical protein PV327_007227 [Microctonus hyperodae]|uniref:COMM domain-containing protein n=1 Tax=Microctonus hyperodae TaxID=165561 RepID=A0AA39KJF0_MICHY|nr:hypothetical protein PV327_007227 [Microctonus hyperodae]